ncbi:FAD-binding protein [Halostagnicola sp. A-GB9-2]|uniref:UDP-N-acetylmuramate dehydrogenase n=1 Tax=Halostagnicola sp. A-GB9-2 TaxID=3048066 RepID=UPI0024C0DD9B|nr:FAD-binding protein [Halostagnicola sp. A-GB9-2]MDJ1434196.1 FAD-binding protein [Halostagnicola sp. A-GB9-2]
MKRITESLADHTWLKIGGKAELAVPETKAELVDLLQECHAHDRPYRILGNGSNLLVSDEGVDQLVIKTTEACTDVEFDGNRANVGASVMAPQFVNACIEQDLGGYEYLYSVPGTIGGAIYMNAGRGKSYGLTIADHLESVEIFDDGEVRELDVDEIEFRHRYSSFQDYDDWVILSATFDLPSQQAEEGRAKARERMQKVKSRERSKPNAGSVFKSGAKLPLQKVPPGGLSVGDAHFVSKNRICHTGGGNKQGYRTADLAGKVAQSTLPTVRNTRSRVGYLEVTSLLYYE